ncbi:sugar ABC transporter ATP-binding protein [Microbacterium sp. BR1]|uniref:sugar ABC transporter ATP-binding protein n=1 Tax=Microbacterium sp. BR1 TaxID=1070896 RepID=UPI0018E1E109|nr:sugar ABC transporter ATP-binding protein [Microbacterium sp. BR1]
MHDRLHLVGMTKRYGTFTALQSVDLALRPGEIHGLCGHNGAGKSTLIKILAGIVPPTVGTMYIDGEEVEFRDPRAAQAAGVALVDQELSVVDALSASDNLALGGGRTSWIVHRGRLRRRAQEVLARVGLASLDPSTPVSELSLGQRQLLEIARALGRDAKILILDEPTATLSEAEIEHVFAAVRNIADAGTSVLFVSHRLGEVLTLCDAVTVLRDGKRVVTAPVGELTRRELVAHMFGAPHAETSVSLRRHDRAEPPTVRLRGIGSLPMISGFDLDIAPGEIVGIAGQLGSGATELLTALAGLSHTAEGSLELDGKNVPLRSRTAMQDAGVEFVGNDRKHEGLFLDQTVDANILATRLATISRLGIIDGSAARSVTERISSLIGLTGRRASAVRGLSGGNQQKVFLGRALERPGMRLLLLDEPTRGVDVSGRAEIHALIRSAAEEGVCVLFASSELDEILDLSDTVVTLFSARVQSVRPRADVDARHLLAEMTGATLDEVIV